MKINTNLGNIAESMLCSYGEAIGVNDIELPVVKVSNVRYDGEFHKEFEIRSFTKKQADKLTVEDGDLLVVKSSGSKANILSGKTAYCTKKQEGNLVASNFLMRLKINKEIAWPRYIWYVLNSLLSKSFVKKITGATTYPNLKWSSYSDHPIYLPPLEDQKRSAAILDKADAIRRKCQQTINLLEEISNSRFYEFIGNAVNMSVKQAMHDTSIGLHDGFTWKRLNEVCLTIQDIDHKMPKAVGSGVPFISAKDLKDDGELSFKGVKYISRENFERLSRKIKPQKHDIIYSRIGVNLGKARLVKRDIEFLTSYSCCTIRPNTDLIDPIYLTKYLDSIITQRQANLDTRSIAVPDLGLDKIRHFLVPVPSLEMQRKLVEQLQAMDKIRISQRDKLSLISNLFNSLAQRAFHGELTTQTTEAA